MQPCKGADDEAWPPCELTWLGVGEGVKPCTSEVRSSPPKGRGGDGVG